MCLNREWSSTSGPEQAQRHSLVDKINGRKCRDEAFGLWRTACLVFVGWFRDRPRVREYRAKSCLTAMAGNDTNSLDSRMPKLWVKTNGLETELRRCVSIAGTSIRTDSIQTTRCLSHHASPWGGYREAVGAGRSHRRHRAQWGESNPGRARRAQEGLDRGPRSPFSRPPRGRLRGYLRATPNGPPRGPELTPRAGSHAAPELAPGGPQAVLIQHKVGQLCLQHLDVHVAGGPRARGVVAGLGFSTGALGLRQGPLRARVCLEGPLYGGDVSVMAKSWKSQKIGEIAEERPTNT